MVGGVGFGWLVALVMVLYCWWYIGFNGNIYAVWYEVKQQYFDGVDILLLLSTIRKQLSWLHFALIVIEIHDCSLLLPVLSVVCCQFILLLFLLIVAVFVVVAICIQTVVVVTAVVIIVSKQFLLLKLNVILKCIYFYEEFVRVIEL